LGEIVKIFNDNKKPIGTLCVGVLLVSDAGLLKDKISTTYNLSRYYDNPARIKKGGVIYIRTKVEFDNNIIGCAGPASTLDLAYKLVDFNRKRKCE